MTAAGHPTRHLTPSRKSNSTMRNVVCALACGAGLLLAPLHANAWWNKDWTQRTRITLNTSAQGLETKEPVTAATIAVRLHSGNFDFVAAKEDGTDLRVVAGDDKTPLKFSVERFDGINELAVLWVQVPTVAASSEKNNLYVYAGNKNAGIDAANAGGFDGATLAAIHFSDKESLGIDHQGVLKTAAPIAIEPNGLLAGSARLSGTPIAWPASDKVKVDAGGALTVSLWVKPEATASGTLFKWGALSMALQGGKLAARVDKTALSGGDVKPQTWTQVALTAGAGKVALYVDGVEAARADATLPALAGPLQIGEGIEGLADELQLSSTVRGAEWLRVAAGAQGAQSKLVASIKEAGDTAEAGSPGYLGILVKNLTTDAWVVIIILGLMFLVAVWVMITKAMFVVRADKDNRQFLQRFRNASLDMLHLAKGAEHPNSSLFRLYQAGVRELHKRDIGKDEQTENRPLSGASLDAVKASVDADLVRESHRLNSQMVFLTIAISGGPFLGLLGTVVGVMITFAAIAAAGDVNVNAIAPGIAAALLATVAGLAVAIPALFGYNYLASRIKNISSDMQIFVDEFVTRVAETYGAR
jgi:biopolymer transport protein ExbB